MNRLCDRLQILEEDGLLTEEVKTALDGIISHCEKSQEKLFPSVGTTERRLKELEHNVKRLARVGGIEL